MRDQRIERRVRKLRGDFKIVHDFYFVRADKIREWKGGALPAHQQLRQWDGWLELQEIRVTDQLEGISRNEFLVVSHRWITPKNPDPDGVKLMALQKYLLDHQEIELVWMDFWCLPQWDEVRGRSEDEDVVFRIGLCNIWMLFLTIRVLVL